MERPSKPANELEGLIRDKLPDPVRRHLTDVHVDRVDAEGFRPNWFGRADWDPKASNDDKRKFIESCLSPSKKKDLRLPTGLSSN